MATAPARNGRAALCARAELGRAAGVPRGCGEGRVRRSERPLAKGCRTPARRWWRSGVGGFFFSSESFLSLADRGVEPWRFPQVLLSGNELELRPFRATGTRRTTTFFSLQGEVSLFKASFLPWKAYEILPEEPSRLLFGRNRMFPAPKMAP